MVQRGKFRGLINFIEGKLIVLVYIDFIDNVGPRENAVGLPLDPKRTRRRRTQGQVTPPLAQKSRLLLYV
jgi:hypothetical protein